MTAHIDTDPFPFGSVQDPTQHHPARCARRATTGTADTLHPSAVPIPRPRHSGRGRLTTTRHRSPFCPDGPGTTRVVVSHPTTGGH